MKRLIVPLLLLITGPALAHGVVWSVNAGASVVEFRYTTDEPMSYAAITVQGPGDTNSFQTGRTDPQGRFAFIPDRDGAWTVTADDGMGHVSTATVPVEGGRTAIARPDPFMASAIHDGWVLRTLLGLSLIGNLGLAVAAVAVRRRKCPP
ncbi:MAG: carboxypeptidase regulatory-like domain-containing protein [Magnetospirillum sp.]|nr:carboxypeptidase regulatory-like domain-containing protein [Magnetospirillum sp.]